MAEGAKKQKDWNFERLYRTVRETLFAYTESRRIEKHPEGQKEGLMFGAASVTYSYLLQHRITGEPQLLEYAGRQAAVLSDVWEEDTLMALFKKEVAGDGALLQDFCSAD